MTRMIEKTRRVYDGQGNLVAVETFMVDDNRPSLAKNELIKSDVVILRCVENDISVPQAWKTYRQTLRDIINGADQDLPERPEYP